MSEERAVDALTRRHGVGLVTIHGLPFLNVDEARFVDMIVSDCKAGRGGWVITPNIDIVRLTDENARLRTLVLSADALVADGMPLIWASHVQRTPLPGRVCGSDLISSVSAAAAAADLSLFLLGGGGDTGARTEEILRRRHPELRIVGHYAPPFGFERDPAQDTAMLEMIAAAAPDIVMVALSFPKGEWLIQRIRSARPDAWWIGVGAAFDFVSGNIKRAPRWMQHAGVEWMFRLSQDPKRLFRRYVLHDLPFAARLARSAWHQRRVGR